jgi:hypothetical protein
MDKVYFPLNKNKTAAKLTSQPVVQKEYAGGWINPFIHISPKKIPPVETGGLKL